MFLSEGANEGCASRTLIRMQCFLNTVKLLDPIDKIYTV